MSVHAATAATRIRPTVPAVPPRFATGLREIVRRGWLLRLVLCLAAVNLLAAGPLLTLAPASRGVLAYALMLSAIGLGAVVGGVVFRYPPGEAAGCRRYPKGVAGIRTIGVGSPAGQVMAAFAASGGGRRSSQTGSATPAAIRSVVARAGLTSAIRWPGKLVAAVLWTMPRPSVNRTTFSTAASGSTRNAGMSAMIGIP